VESNAEDIHLMGSAWVAWKSVRGHSCFSWGCKRSIFGSTPKRFDTEGLHAVPSGSCQYQWTLCFPCGYNWNL